MAEKKGFFRKIFSFGSDDEASRTPEEGGMPAASDTETGRADAPDPDARPVAAAHSVADSEAGASVEDGGGITPLKDAARGSPSPQGSEGEGGEAQKKTLNAGETSPT